ncbi:MAG: T9SS type A sorting domain-containing protein, partial [Rhodothermales bacterium]|nr:T9SS type A sorting domain-containing protein [Rhodothermales bacterium]
AMSGATFIAGEGENIVSWTHNAEFGGYNEYASENAIDAAAIENNEASLIGSLAFDADEFAVRHSFEVPHPSLAPIPLNYAVTSKSLFGVENTDVSASTMEVANADLPLQTYILMATEDEGNVIFDNVAGSVLSDDGFPDVPAFVVDSSHNKAADAPLPDDDADMSATVKVTVDPLGFMSVYADVTDDIVAFAGEAVPGTDTWNYDALELGIGLYDVRDVGGSILGGSPHIDFMRGAEADFQMRFAPRVNEAGDIVNVSVHSSSDPANGGGNVNGEIQGGGGVAEKTDTGWRILVTFPLDSIIDAGEGDVPFSAPGDTDIKLIPFNVAFNDADAGGTRESQMIWSTKANAGNGWWNTPAQWPAVAVAGRATATNVEGPDAELPFDFALEQNYPNPFNPSTTIEFSLAKVENVRLSVYNVLGQRVASLLSGESLQAGPHTVNFDASQLTSGMYFYRIDAGTSFSKTRTMMLLK